MNMRNSIVLWLAGLLSGGLLAGCLVSPTSPAGDVSSLHTQAVQTVSAQLTLDAGGTAVALLTQMAQPSSTPTLDLFINSSPIPWIDTATPLPSNRDTYSSNSHQLIYPL